MTESHVAILGAGWAGLAAAVQLAQAGRRVTVFEAARQVGGRARRIDWHGELLDNGQHILLGAYRDTLSMMRRVGVDPHTALLRLPLTVEYPGRFALHAANLPAPLHLALGLLRCRGLGLSERLQLLRYFSLLRAKKFRQTPDGPLVKHLDQAGLGAAARRFLLEPLAVAALNTPVAVASTRVFLRTLADSIGVEREASDLLLPRVDLSQLFPQPAADFIQARGVSLRLGVAVKQLILADEGFAFDDESEIFSHVIVALPPRRAQELLSRHIALAPTAGLLAGLTDEPITTCYLQYPPDVRLPQPMLGVGINFGQWAFDRGQLEGRAGLIAVVISTGGVHSDYGSAELSATLHEELAALLPDLPDPLWSRVFIEKRATFACRYDTARPPRHTAVPRLWLAGDYVHSDYPATLEAAVRSGIAAADEVLRDS